MSIEAAIARGRAAAEALMVDACTIQRPGTETTSATGVVTPSLTSIYAGKCRLQVRQQTGAGQNIGEAYVIVERLELQLPMTTPALMEGDVVTMTASTLDPLLPGKKYTVRDTLAKTHLTSRRVTVLEVTS
jgi:hypothetical protein